jgi:hypothetical protein
MISVPTRRDSSVKVGLLKISVTGIRLYLVAILSRVSSGVIVCFIRRDKTGVEHNDSELLTTPGVNRVKLIPRVIRRYLNII